MKQMVRGGAVEVVRESRGPLEVVRERSSANPWGANPHQPEVERLLMDQGFAGHGYTRAGETFYHPEFPGVPVVVGWGPGQNPLHANPYTPGPWILVKRPDGSYAIWDELGRLIGFTRAPGTTDLRIGSPQTPEAIEANAKLMKAAPELLDSAKLTLLGLERIRTEAPRIWARFRDDLTRYAEHAKADFGQGYSDLAAAVKKAEER